MQPEDQMPDDPFEATPLALPAATVHELFVSYLNAGFERSEALYLAGVHLAVVGQFTLEHQVRSYPIGGQRAPRRRTTFAGGFCPAHSVPLVTRGLDETGVPRVWCLMCDMGIPPLADTDAPMPDAGEASAALGRCAVCGGPLETSPDGTMLICAEHPPGGRRPGGPGGLGGAPW